MATGTGNLPNPSMSFSPFAILTAEQMNNLVSNINSLATGTGIGDESLTSNKFMLGAPIQMVTAQYSALATGSTQIPTDDTIPQNNEGDEYMTLAITPKSSTNILLIEATGFFGFSSAVGRNYCAALFRNTTADAFAVNAIRSPSGDIYPVSLGGTQVAGSTSEITFKFRAGANSTGTLSFNGQFGARLYGDVVKSFIKITEYKAS